jgi:hypothetical protein
MHPQRETVQQDSNILSSLLERFSKWLQLKIYQIEVSFCVYIFTPAEKFIFCMSSVGFRFLSPVTYHSSFASKRRLTRVETGSVAFLLISLTSLAAALYLPQHIMFIVGRAWYYINGEASAVTKEVVVEVVKEVGRSGTATAIEAAKTSAGVVREL